MGMRIALLIVTETPAFRLKAAASLRTKLFDDPQKRAQAYFAELNHSGRHFYYTGRYSDRSPDFRSALGFIPRVDIRQATHFARYQWRPERRRVLSVGPVLSTLINWDRQGRVQDWLVNPVFQVEFSRLTFLSVGRAESFELFEGRGFRKNTNGLSFFSEWLRWLGTTVSYEQGASVNFFPASGLQPFGANSINGRFELRLRPAPQVRLDQTYIYSRLGVRPDSAPPGISPLVNIFNNHILRTKLNWQFTRELSLRTILDYNAVLSNPLLVDQERAKRFTADVLVTYLINPGTALYVGYTDSYENLALDSTVEPRLRRTVSPATLTGRQFFVELRYLFRF